MTRTYLIPYNTGSRSARALARELGITRINKERNRINSAGNRLLINWGNSWLPDKFEDPDIVGDGFLLNPPIAVRLCANKHHFFRQLRNSWGGEALIPDFCTTMEGAERMLDRGIRRVVCRTSLTGHSGDGIIIAESPDDLVEAPLYVEYIPKTQEFRVHVFSCRYGEEVVGDIQRKGSRRSVPDSEVNWQIRNHQTGFVYTREDGRTPRDFSVEADQPMYREVERVALEAFMRTPELDFGAVDVIWNERRQAAYVLEINTAPGLEGSTLQTYANYFTTWME